MAITVASGALDTTWVEFSTVAYTTSTLADLSACIEQVQVKLNRGTLGSGSTPTDTQVGEWIIRAKQELAESKRFTFRRRYVTTNLTAGSYRYSLPQDFANPINMRDKTNDVPIRFYSQHIFDTMYPDPDEQTSGKILIATVKNMELWVCPPPDGADEVELEYERTGDDIDATDMSWLPEIERWRCCDFALGESFMALNQYEKATMHFSRWERGLMKAARADGKKRWSSMGYRARSLFQA